MLLLQCRNFGDAVISTGLIEALSRSGQNIEWHVLTRRNCRSIYSNSPFVTQVHVGEFPMGTGRSFGVAEARALLATVFGLRRLGFDRVVNICGDLRENLLGWTVAPAANSGPRWPAAHPNRHHVRQGMSGLLRTQVQVPVDQPSLYAAVQRIATALGATAPARQRLYDLAGQPYLHRASGQVIGLHPVTSLNFKEWPLQRWRALASLIRQRGWKMVLFGAPAERERLSASFEGLTGNGTDIFTGSLDEFFARLSGLSAYVGLDSFGAHAAQAIGTPSVVLNGPNFADLFRPPDAVVIDGGAGLPCHPCYGRPMCQASAEPYRCIRGIAETMVIQHLERLVRAGASGRQD
jgi:ADP-heptose:LPS heptosyltransferase